MRFQEAVLVLAALGSMVPAMYGQTDSSSAAMLGGLHWREVGPMRGGRTYGVSGNAAEPDTFYMGSVGGGRLEDRERRPDLAADQRYRHPHWLDWSHRGSTFGPEDCVRGHRRAGHTQPALVRHRHV